MKPESKLWQLIKKKTPKIQWTRLESWASFGVPDLLGYHENCGFFMLEMKVTRGKKIHQFNIPAKNITNCTFGGPKNNELFISTAVKGTHYSDLKKYPLSGSLFKVKTNSKGKYIKSFKSSVLTF